MLLTIVLAACMNFTSPEVKKAAKPMIGHMVYFKLKDNTAENRKKLVDACEKYLADRAAEWLARYLPPPISRFAALPRTR